MDSFKSTQTTNIVAPQTKRFSPFIIQFSGKHDFSQDNTHFDNSYETESVKEQEYKIEVQEQKNLSDMIDETNSHSQKLKRARTRKNKNQKIIQIQINQKDDGRGGNCIASNISKTLIRIIYATLKGASLLKFKEVAQTYQIKSQKQNTVILINFLYLFAELEIIEVNEFQKIIFNFMMNLKDARQNCQKRADQQTHRAQFHKKNKRMYQKFIKLSESIAFPLIKKIKTKSDYTLSLMELEEIISDTYDRKQRQIQKAISKLKSIILNYKELQQLYSYHLNRNVDSFFQAIDYAYRRNLPKRCKQIKSKAQQVYCSFLENTENINDKQEFLVFYSVLDIISQKKQQIWKQFVNNVMLKIKYNCSKIGQQTLKNSLIVVVPKLFQQKLKELSHQKDQDITAQGLQSAKIQGSGLIFIQNMNDNKLIKMKQSYASIKKEFHL